MPLGIAFMIYEGDMLIFCNLQDSYKMQVLFDSLLYSAGDFYF